MKWQSYTRVLGSALLAAGLLVALAPAARAQSPGTSVPADQRPPYWESIGGFEGDTHDTGYGFFGPAYNHPISENVAITGQVFGTYLFYEFDNSQGGRTSVRSPGISPAVGLRFGRKTTVKFTVGLSAKHESREIRDHSAFALAETDRWRTGASLGSDLYWNLTSRDNIHALVNYTTQDRYLWTRAGYKRQVSNLDWKGHTTLYLGVEGITQGNKDIWSNQAGALAEVLLVPSHVSLMFRGGYKRSTFDIGPDKSGPYYGVGLYKRF
jgi:hypothetical protein